LRLAEDDGDKVLPACIISAHETGYARELKVNGRIAVLCELRLQFRVAGYDDDASKKAEALAANGRDAFFAGFGGQPGWIYVTVINVTDERGIDDKTRTHTLVLEMRCLTAA
jgi:hypothetical protein